VNNTRGDASQAPGDLDIMSTDLSERVADLEAWVEVVMVTLATLGLENLLIRLDEARRAYDEEDK
jgi:hypothetical protein